MEIELNSDSHKAIIIGNDIRNTDESGPTPEIVDNGTDTEIGHNQLYKYH